MSASDAKHRVAVASGAPWEGAIGYSRAVSVGERIYVAGTTAVDSDGRLVGGSDPYAQAVYILDKIGAALSAVDASPADIVRTRIYVTDISSWTEVARAHREVFGALRPVNTLVGVSALIRPDLLVEIEAEAVRGYRAIVALDALRLPPTAF